MWWLLTEHHVLPGQYYALPEGEKTLLKAFWLMIREQRREARR